MCSETVQTSAFFDKTGTCRDASRCFIVHWATSFQLLLLGVFVSQCLDTSASLLRHVREYFANDIIIIFCADNATSVAQVSTRISFKTAN